MFRSMFDHLFNQAKDPDLKETIRVMRDSEKIHAPAASGKAHKAVWGALTWIGNAARKCGEPELGDMAREMRDENLGKFEEDWQ